MKKTFICFILISFLVASVGAASAIPSSNVVDMSHKSISTSQYTKVVSNIHFDKNVKDISHFRVSKNTNSHSIKIELTDEYAEAHTQTVGIPISDLSGFVEFVRIQHFDNSGVCDSTQLVKPKIIDDVAYMDISLSSVTITPYVNSVKNSGFENWSTSTVPEDWVDMGSTGGVQSWTSMSGGSYSIVGGGTTGVYGWIKQPTTITPGNYTIGAWILSQNMTNSYVAINLEDGTPSVSSHGTGAIESPTWAWYEYREYINSTNPNINMYLYCGSALTPRVWVDDVVLSPDYSYTASETSDTSHLYQSFTYTPVAVNDPAEFITWFETANITDCLNPTSTVTVDGSVVTSKIDGNQVRFDVSGLPIAAHNVQVTITFTPNINANFTANTTGVVAGNPIQFTDTSTGSPTGWLWNFGDGISSTEQNPTHVYTTSGTKTVSLTATSDYSNDIETKNNYVTVVYNAPDASFTSYKEYGYQFQFTDTSTNSPTSWSWNFGDGNTSVAQNPTHLYWANGSYNVTLTATNPAGHDHVSHIVTMSAQKGHSAISSTDQLVMVDVNETHSFNFTSNITLDHTIFYVNDVAMAVTGNELEYTFPEDSGGKYYNVSAVGYSGDSIKSNQYTWVVQVRRLRATQNEKIEEFNTSDYDNFVDNYSKFDSEGMITNSVTPYTNLIGRSFYLILFALPFVLLWQKQGRMTIPTTLALITGALFIGFIPEQYIDFIVYAIILSFAGNLYMMGRQSV